jgi:hypothetical protein
MNAQQWQEECAYIQNIAQQSTPGETFKNDWECFWRYVDMQAECALRQDFIEISAEIAKCAKYTIVSFRIWPAGEHWRAGEVIAIFPEQEGGRRGACCGSYMHVGQHSDCDPRGVIRETKRATAEESKALRAELTQIGYRLREVKRIPPGAYWWAKK